MLPWALLHSHIEMCFDMNLQRQTALNWGLRGACLINAEERLLGGQASTGGVSLACLCSAPARPITPRSVSQTTAWFWAASVSLGQRPLEEPGGVSQ